ncbi:hypothetical protein [Streptomyces viridochromogenes]|uniref:hypothetical protein n=1 Tax=Streptomyces viridochromogenes TaxID=1938 RepID=UPI001F270533|nr:hypothetical protein [Streptomyces viridochromogenes]
MSGARFPGIDLQPIHGDSPPANVFSGVDGDLYADFELVTRGARRNGTRPLDEEVLGFVNALGMLRVVATLTLVPQLPELMEYLQPAVDHMQTDALRGRHEQLNSCSAGET